jgi:hypothetical protein
MGGTLGQSSLTNVLLFLSQVMQNAVIYPPICPGPLTGLLVVPNHSLGSFCA